MIVARPFIVILALAAGLAVACCDVSVPSIFGSNMVLQQGKKIPVWGWGDPGEAVTVEIAGQKVRGVTKPDGTWRVELATLAVRESGDMVIRGRNTLTLQNVAVGEVWFCSGQSNMAMFLADMGEQAVASAGDPDLRLYWVSSLLSGIPVKDRDKVSWQPSTPKSAYKMSAQAHYFGRALRKQLGVPVGLIASAIGGSRIEPWIPAEVCASTPELADASKRINELNSRYLDEVEKTGKFKEWVAVAREAVLKGHALPPLPPMSGEEMVALPVHPMTLDKQEPSTLYNGLVNPFVGFPVRGILWQQGFSNQADGYGYLPKIKALADFWREHWGQDVPIYYVQYPACKMISPEFRDVQTAMMKTLPNSAMVVCNDLSYGLDLHPKNKDKVGERLAMLALANTYHVPMKAWTGPLYRSMRVENGKIRVSFDQVGSGLVSRDAQLLTCFEVAGETGGYVKAEAVIDGDDVLVWSEKITTPARVRMGWDPIAEPNLMNKEGLPASIFRSHRDG